MRNEKLRVTTRQLSSAIEALLASGPCILDDIADALCYSTAAVRSRLFQLMKEERVHRRRIPCENNAALFYCWHAGKEPGGPERIANRDVADLPPVQITVCSYPAINRRDPMVAAFFGQQGRVPKMVHASTEH